MFTAALFTIAKTLKQPKCPSTEDMYKYNRTVVSQRKEQNFAICNNMDGLGGLNLLSEI